MYLDVAFSIRPFTYGKNFLNKEHSSPLTCTNGDPVDDGRVVSVSNKKSESPRFESRSDHFAIFVLSRPEFKSSAMPRKSQLIAFCQLFFLTLLCSIWIICFQLFEWSAWCKLQSATKLVETLCPEGLLLLFTNFKRRK